MVCVIAVVPHISAIPTALLLKAPVFAAVIPNTVSRLIVEAAPKTVAIMPAVLMVAAVLMPAVL